MPATATRILVVGSHSPAIISALGLFWPLGWVSQSIGKLAEARHALKTSHVCAILSAEFLPDGTGYDLTDVAVEQSGTLLVGVKLSENRLWLPVVEHGRRVLGTRAIAESALRSEIEALILPSPRHRLAAALRSSHIAFSKRTADEGKTATRIMLGSASAEIYTEPEVKLSTKAHEGRMTAGR
jgi:hypothetical protein